MYKREMDFGKYILGRLRFNRSLERIISEIGPVVIKMVKYIWTWPGFDLKRSFQIIRYKGL